MDKPIPNRPVRVDFQRPLPQLTRGKGYSIIDELYSISSGMSLMDVLKSCPNQREAFLTALSVSIPDFRRDIFMFDPTDLPPLEIRRANLSSPFMIQIDIGEFTIQRVIVDPGSSINIMAISIFEQLGLGDLYLTTWVCQGYDKSCKMPLGQMPVLITLDEKTVTVEVAVLN